MNKSELIELIMGKSNLSHADIEHVIDEFLLTIEKEVAKGNDVKISSFGVFYKKTRQARRGTNPGDGKLIVIPESNTLGFRPSKSLKKKLNS